jgi:hypothetical protein
LINLNKIDIHNLAILLATSEIILKDNNIADFLSVEEVEAMRSMLNIIMPQIIENEELYSALTNSFEELFINSVYNLINNTGHAEGIH